MDFANNLETFFYCQKFKNNNNKYCVTFNTFK